MWGQQYEMKARKKRIYKVSLTGHCLSLVRTQLIKVKSFYTRTKANMEGGKIHVSIIY